jgi:putative serine protease PepD
MQVTTQRLVVGAVVLAVVSATIGGLTGALVQSGSDDAPESALAAGSPANPAGCDVTGVAARVFPSLVTVNAHGKVASGTGSGSVLDRQGNILTNDHVIAPAAGGTLTVDFARGPMGRPATLVGRDPLTDLAVIRVQADAASLSPIAVGRSTALVVGQPVVAAGSPLGLNGTITAGVVSALNRYIDVGQGSKPATLVNAIQTDAAVNPGNSGGPLTDCSGAQVGVNSAGAQTPGGAGGSIGLNFAIPMDFAGSVADEIIRTGRVVHPIIGVLTVSVTAELAAATGLARGALVEQVLPGLGAARAGLQRGDVITRVGDTEVSSTDEMLIGLRAYRPGENAELTYTRDGTSRGTTVSVTEA